MVTARLRNTPSVIQVSCLLTDQVGDSVYIRAQANGFYKVARANPADSTKMPVIGAIIRKWDFTNALVQLFGEAKVYTGLTPGKTYWVDRDSRPVLMPPEPDPGERIYTQVLGVALDVGVLLVTPDPTIIVRVG